MLTQQEKRVVFYAADVPPTVASDVTPDTPLESLNLNWHERDL